MNILLAILIGFGGGWYIAPTQKVECRDVALIQSECPPLPKMVGDDFGATTITLMQDSARYQNCRKACLAGQQGEEK